MEMNNKEKEIVADYKEVLKSLVNTEFYLEEEVDRTTIMNWIGKYCIKVDTGNKEYPYTIFNIYHSYGKALKGCTIESPRHKSVSFCIRRSYKTGTFEIEALFTKDKDDLQRRAYSVMINGGYIKKIGTSHDLQ